MSYIFISYAKQDIQFARHLKNLLQQEGFAVWIDEQQTSFNSQQWPAVKRIIATCSAYIVIMSPDSQKSRHVENELAMARDLRKPTFPILLAGKLNAILAELGYADMTAGLDAALPARLLRELKNTVPTNKDDIPPQLEDNGISQNASPELTPEIMLPMARVLLMFVGLIIIILIFINNDDNSPESLSTPTQSIADTETVSTSTKTAVIELSSTFTSTPTSFDPEATINARITLTREAINTKEAQAVAILQATQDIVETATYQVLFRETQIALDSTATAIQWTHTPTATSTSTSTSTPTQNASNTPIPTITATHTQLAATQTPLPPTLEYDVPYGWYAGTTLYVQYTIGLSESAGFEPTDPVQYQAGDPVIVGVGLVAPWTYREWYILPKTQERLWAIESGGGGWLPESALGEKSP